MTKSQRVPITITPERQQMFDAIWLKLPHLKGSVTATVDYLGSLYLDGRFSAAQSQPVSLPETKVELEKQVAEPTLPTTAIEDEW